MDKETKFIKSKELEDALASNCEPTCRSAFTKEGGIEIISPAADLMSVEPELGLRVVKAAEARNNSSMSKEQGR